VTILRSVLLPAAFVAAITLPAGAFAQQAASPAMAPAASMRCGQQHEGRGGAERSRFAALNLTPQQKAQIKQIHQQYRAAHPCGSKPDPAARAQMRQQVLNVLTPQQRAQLQAQGGWR